MKSLRPRKTRRSRSRDPRANTPASQKKHDFAIAEYNSLRNESQRCAQLLSNAVWIAVTGFGLTIAGAASLVSKDQLIDSSVVVSAVILMLCIQAMAISTIYISELWQYARIGCFLRRNVENGYPPVKCHWEHWIKNQRARSLYLTSLSFLQLPIILTALLGLSLATAKTLQSDQEISALVRLSRLAFHDNKMNIVISIVVLLNVCIILILGIRLIKDENSGFARKRTRQRDSQKTDSDVSPRLGQRP